jgi:hypothetical protein
VKLRSSQKNRWITASVCKKGIHIAVIHVWNVSHLRLWQWCPWTVILIHAGSLHGLLLDTEDEGGILLRNVGWLTGLHCLWTARYKWTIRNTAVVRNFEIILNLRFGWGLLVVTPCNWGGEPKVLEEYWVVMFAPKYTALKPRIPYSSLRLCHRYNVIM